MVKFKDMVYFDNLEAKVPEVFSKLKTEGVKRLPILSSERALVALVFLEGLYDISEADRPTKTLKDLLEEKPNLKQSSAYFGENATLADVKEAMARIADCRVAFVTKTGNPDEAVIGMLTNTDIADHSTA